MMTCPQCAGSVLIARHRHNVEIDVCGSCGGVWLQRGELDRILDRARAEIGDDDVDDHDGDHSHRDRPLHRDDAGRRARRPWWAELFD